MADMTEVRGQLDLAYRLLRATEDAVMAERRRERELAAADADERATSTGRLGL